MGQPPVRGRAVADLDGDGKDEVICGTHYYWASVLDADAKLRWKYRFGSICYDIATGRFDEGQTRGVVFGSGDGMVHYVDSNGTLQMQYDTGEVQLEYWEYRDDTPIPRLAFPRHAEPRFARYSGERE